MIKGLLGGGRSRCGPLGERVAWASLLRRERRTWLHVRGSGYEAHWDEKQARTDHRSGQLLALSRRSASAWPVPTRSPKARRRPTAADDHDRRPALQAPACANGVDDDGDGLVDIEDPDCDSPADTSEEPTAAAPAGSAADPATAAPPAERRRRGSRTGRRQAGQRRSAATPAAASRRRHPQRKPRRRQRRQRQRRRRHRARAPPAAATSRCAEGHDGGSQFAAGGTPTAANPTTTIAPFGPAPIGVPNFVIDSFEIPPFLLPIYQACGTEYGIPWEVLASINKIETGFGTNLNVSSAGAIGWMQFLPSSWEAFGLDANGDGRKDPYNPVDAICAAAHYLKLAGGTNDLYDAIFAYNHADWYVQEVLALRPRLRQAALRPGRLADRPHRGRPLPGRRRRPLRRRHLGPRSAEELDRRRRVYGNAAEVISSSPTRRGINIFADAGRAGRRRQRRRDPQARQLRRSSATSSSSKTPTATATPTPSSARSSATTAWW